MAVELRYGRGTVAVRIPQHNIGQIIRPWGYERKRDNHSVIASAISDASGGIGKLHEQIADAHVCILLSDGTRDMPLSDILPEICQPAVSSRFTQFLICTGTHNPNTPENRNIVELTHKIARQVGIRNFDIAIHNCQDEQFANSGRTKRGTPVLFNARAEKADVFIVLSDMKYHYFAGYSNPIKNFVPGICAYSTAENNHSLALDERSQFGMHPWHPRKKQRANPLAEDMLEAMQMILDGRAVYAFVTITAGKQIQWARFGKARAVTSEAMSVIDKRNLRRVAPTDRLIVSPGGFPQDESLYTCQRALELTADAVKDNGEILFISECVNGIGSELTLENFYKTLTTPVDSILKSAQAEYKLFSHKPYKFARMIKRLRRIWVYSAIPGPLLERAHLFPTSDPNDVVDGWLSENSAVKINIVDGASNIAICNR